MEYFLTAFDSVRALTPMAVLMRTVVAVLMGGIIGLERGMKNRPAGLRTHMLVCLGASMVMMTNQFIYQCYSVGDPVRMSAQVISGIGFLGAGTVIVTGRQEVKGLTTGAGLWACACMGLAIGAGFYECVVLAFVLIILAIRVLPAVENFAMEHARNMNLYVQFDSLDSIGRIIACIKTLDVQIYHVEIDRGGEEPNVRPGARFSLRLKKRRTQEQLMAELSQIPEVYSIESV